MTPCRHYKRQIATNETASKSARRKKKSVQPRVVIIGSPVSIAWVVLPDVKYIFEKVKDAVEACMAIYLGLNIEYPQEAERIWYFLQKYVFKFNCPTDLEDCELLTCPYYKNEWAFKSYFVDAI